MFPVCPSQLKSKQAVLWGPVFTSLRPSSPRISLLALLFAFSSSFYSWFVLSFILSQKSWLSFFSLFPFFISFQFPVHCLGFFTCIKFVSVFWATFLCISCLNLFSIFASSHSPFRSPLSVFIDS